MHPKKTGFPGSLFFIGTHSERETAVPNAPEKFRFRAMISPKKMLQNAEKVVIYIVLYFNFILRYLSMKKLSAIFTFCMFFVLGIFGFSATASAYIDPSAMTYIVQVIVGIVVVGGAAFGFYFNKLKRALRKKKGDKQPENVPVVTDEEIDDDGEFDDFEAEE